MTELAQSTAAAEIPLPEGAFHVPPLRQPDPPRQPASGRRGIGWLACAAVGALATVWFIFFSPGELGTRSEWFFGAVVFCAVVATMYQTLVAQRQIRQDTADAAEQLRRELATAEQRTARELVLMRDMHRTSLAAQQQQHRSELESLQQLHRSEMQAQQQLAQVQQLLLREQLQKQAMVDVSRAVGSHAQMLATLWDQGASILRIDDRDAREQAMNPVFAQISHVVNDFSVELANAHLVVDDDRLHQMLDDVNAAVLMAIRVAEDVQAAVLDGHAPEPNPIPGAQRLLHQRAAEARHLAWELLRNRLGDHDRNRSR